MFAAAQSPVCGIVLLDKPTGIGSNAALQRVKRLYGTRKAGHTGNLDPLASGMLPICLGEATKIAGSLLDARKQYQFTLLLGERTVSGDAEHEVIERRPVPPLGLADVLATVAQFSGPRLQVPPMHSALKHEGERLYRLARRGLEVRRDPRPIVIEEIAVVQWASPQLTLRATCSKGTYVRVLAEEIAAALGTCGYVIGLRRSWTAPFAGGEMVGLDALEQADTDERARWLLPTDHALQAWPRVDLPAEEARRIAHGQVLHVPQGAPPPGLAVDVRLYGPGGRFMGLGILDPQGRLRPKRLMDLGL